MDYYYLYVKNLKKISKLCKIKKFRPEFCSQTRVTIVSNRFCIIFIFITTLFFFHFLMLNTLTKVGKERNYGDSIYNI